MLKLYFDRRNRKRLLLSLVVRVKVEVIGVAALVGLRAFYCGHERVRDGRVVVGGGVVVRGRGAVEGDGEAEVEGLELEAWGVRAVSGT